MQKEDFDLAVMQSFNVQGRDLDFYTGRAGQCFASRCYPLRMLLPTRGNKIWAVEAKVGWNIARHPGLPPVLDQITNMIRLIRDKG